jgi:hypothetical protein
MESVGIFYGHLEYFTAICYVLWPFGNVVVIWHIFPPFWYIVSRKIWQPWVGLCKVRNKVLFKNRALSPDL